MDKLSTTVLIAVMGLLLPSFGSAEDAPKLGVGEYIEYLPGTLPIVIAAPHGGTLRPDGIPNRTFGRVAQDSYTQELARAIREELFKTYGGHPHVIICRLHRMKVDCNRELDEAAQGDAVASRAWHEFQGFIGDAKNAVMKRHGYGLFIDLHGHRHPEARVELGYLLGREILQRPDAELETDERAKKAISLRDLVSRSTASFTELLRGGSSLGGMLEARGFPSVPSPAFPAPLGEEEYFSGGYNTQVHGSANGGGISGLQIECPFKGVRDREENRKKFAAALSDALGEWWLAHFSKKLEAVPARTLSQPAQ